MTLKQLGQRLNNANSALDYFKAIYRYVELSGSGMELKDGFPTRVIFFAEDFSPKLARLILDCPSSTAHFSTVQEIRIVATRIDEKLAQEFRGLNPTMRIFWMSGDDWVGRVSGSPDPSGLEWSYEQITDKNAPLEQPVREGSEDTDLSELYQKILPELRKRWQGFFKNTDAPQETSETPKFGGATVLGVYPVKAKETCHLIEMQLKGLESPFDFGKITQPRQGFGRAFWQVPWMETLLSQS